MPGMQSIELKCLFVRLEKWKEVSCPYAVHHVVILGFETVHKRFLCHICEG